LFDLRWDHAKGLGLYAIAYDGCVPLGCPWIVLSFNGFGHDWVN